MRCDESLPRHPCRWSKSAGAALCRGGRPTRPSTSPAWAGAFLLAGVVGEDAYARTLSQLLVGHGVPTDGLVADPGRSTTTKSRVIAHSQQVVRVDCENRHHLPGSVEDRLLSWIDDQVPRVDAVVLSDYAKGVASPRFTQALIRVSRAANRPVMIDPKGLDVAKYSGASLIKPNLREAELLSQREIQGEVELLDAAGRILRHLDGGAVLITRGSAGMSLFRRQSAPFHVPALTREVFDVTGAGDTVTATSAMALAAGATFEQATRLANIAAGIAVGKIGTTAVTLRQLADHLEDPRQPEGAG